jgi:hypothetical protein
MAEDMVATRADMVVTLVARVLFSLIQPQVRLFVLSGTAGAITIITTSSYSR